MAHECGSCGGGHALRPRGPDARMAPMHFTRWALAAGLAMVAAAGCGSGDALSKSELAAKANEICTKYSKEGDALKAPANIGDPEQAHAFFEKAHGIAKRQQDDLEALSPADDVKDAYADLTRATGKATTLLDDLAQAAQAKDADKGAQLLQQLQPDSKAVDQAAKAVGATDCAG